MISLLTSLFLSLLISPWFIARLRKKQMGQVVRDDGPKSHLSKAGTPTMGGVIIIFSVLLPCLLWMDWSNHYLWCSLLIFSGYGLVGFFDDYLKISKKNSRGVSARGKMTSLILIAGLVCTYHFFYTGQNGSIYVPFLKNVNFDIGLLYIPFAIFIIVGTSNAVNLTDGLDGLAIGPVMSSAACFALLSYISGHHLIAEYLQLPYVKNVGELAIFASCLVGASMGFLWYNTYPAQVFMGDVGSLALGGALGALAVFSKHELLLCLIGGVFVLETISVITQVLSFKLRKKRVFRMAPIHHHFELNGWPEPKVIVRFWIISVILALLSLLSLKIR